MFRDEEMRWNHPRHEKVPPAKEEEVKKDATVKTKWTKGNEEGAGVNCVLCCRQVKMSRCEQ